MKKHNIIFFITTLLFISRISAQTFVPMPCTGWNIDGVAENTTAISTTGGALDASDFVLYSQNYGLSYPGAAGLPNNGLMVSGSRTYQLASYTTSNTVHQFANGVDTLYFTNPQAWPQISLLCFGTQGNATASVTVRFADNSTQTFNPLNMTDWFTISPAIFSGFDRVLRSTGVPALVGGAGNPRMQSIDLPILCANQGKAITKLIIRNTSASAHLCVMAVSGQVPAYNVSGNTLICSSGSSTLNASGFSSYTWTPVGNFAGSNNATITVNPSSSTVYTLTGTDGTGCPGYTTIPVVVSNNPPTLSLAGSTQSVCLGAPATITASGALAYTLSSPAANGGSFVPNSTAVYTVYGSNGCGTASVTTTITVAPLVISATAVSNTVCSGSTATLTASGAQSYTWMPGSATQTVFTPAPTANTIYTLSGKTASCNATATIAITADPLPTLNIAPSNSNICNGETVTLTVSGNANTYTWTPGNQNATSIVVAPTTTTLYAVAATNSLNCIGNLQQVIFVRPTPTVVIAATKYSVCPAGSSTLTASGASTYTWNNGNTNASLQVNPSATQVYTATGTSTNGCFSSNTVQVVVMTPTVAVSPSSSICAGSGLIINASGANSYTWVNNGSTFSSYSVSPASTTIYTVNASVSYSQAAIICLATNTVQVAVNPNPTLTSSSTRTAICKGEKTVLTATAGNASITYVWSSGTATVAGSSNTVSPVVQVQYTVTGTDANGCQGTSLITVRVAPCTGIAHTEDGVSNLSIYPNPAKGTTNISAESNCQVEILNGLGQTVRKANLDSSNEFSLKVEGLVPGLYFITASTENSKQTFRLIIE